MSDAPPGFPPPPPAPKKKTSGCLIALVVSGVIVLLLGIGLGIATYAFAQTDQGKAMMAAVGVAAAAGQGPGPDALRAAGCKDAAAIRYDEMNKAARPLLVDAGPNDEVFGKGIEVLCMDPTKPITCEEVARLFAAADKSTSEFTAIVRANTQDRCKITANADGTPKP